MATPADVHGLTGAYAADALDDLERADFERHLAECDLCREEVRGFQETLVRLAEGSAVTPPEGLRLSVMEQIRLTPQQRRPPASPSRPAARRPRAAWVVAAASLLVALFAGGFGLQQYQAAQGARDRVVAIESVVGDPAARRISGPATGGGQITVVVAGPRAALLTAGLPALSAGRTYQLWIVRPQAITSAGLGPAGAAGAGSWSRLVNGVRQGDVVAVSVEPDGGSAQPTTTPLVTLAV
jgi:anti-sigma-K factor RskA